MLDQNIKFEETYREWIREVSTRFKRSQIKAATKVNQEMIMFYWELGRDIDSIKNENKYGSGFYKKLSKDLMQAIPEVKSFSPRNLRYMKDFYGLYSNELNLQQVVANSELNLIFKIPWGHHTYILDKCKGNKEKALFYVRKILENNWSRSVLLNFMDTNLYERQGKAISNFSTQLPDAQGDLAKELTKDPYNFDFLTLSEDYNEKELKDALTENIVRFLFELGNGFAFVGKEYLIEVGETEQYIDLLFYNTRLHCYIVVEIKTEKFKPADIGQLGTYIVAVNHILKMDVDNPTIGLLICKGKDEVLAHYAVESSGEPIGISEYELSKVYPADFKSSLPSIEEIEKTLKRKNPTAN